MLEKIHSPDELQRVFDAGAFRRGVAYFREGRVLTSRRERGAGQDTITGQVRGSGSHIYEVYVVIGETRSGVSVEGDCSCPVEYNCKHVVSVVLDQLQRAQPEPRRPRRRAGRAEPIDPALGRWLEQLAQSLVPAAPPSYPGHQPNRLLYLLHLAEAPWTTQALEVTPVICRLLKRGGYGKAAPFSTQRAWQPHPPDYVLPQDVVLLRRLAPEPYAPSWGRLTLRGGDGAQLLADLIGTGRCHWRHQDAPPLRLAPARPSEPAWVLGQDGKQRLLFQARPAAELVLPVAPPWYLDGAQCGPLNSPLDPALAGALAAAPAIAPAQVKALRGILDERLPQISIPRPSVVQTRELRTTPRPWLRLGRDSIAHGVSRRALFVRAARAEASARLGFDYAGHRLEYANPEGAPLVKGGDELLRIRRDRRSEEQAYHRLLEAGLAPASQLAYGLPAERGADLVARRADDEAKTWLSLQLDLLPALRDEGWRIDLEPDFPYPLVHAGEWYGELDEEPGENWFDLDLGLVLEGRRVSLLPLLLEWLRTTGDDALEAFRAGNREGRPFSVKLQDGAWLTLPADRVAVVLETLVELYDPELKLEQGRLRLPQLRAAQLVDLELDTPAEGVWRWQGGERLRELGRRLRDFQGIAQAPVPRGFGAELRPYQQEGLNWLQFLREYGLGGVLADDMGLGKTVQALAHLLTEKQAGRMDRPSLVVAPTSLMVNWRLEARRFAPGLRLLTLHGQDRARHFARLRDHDLLLTTYPLLSRDQEVLLGNEFHLLILDEAQNIKNPRSQASQVVGRLRARHRLCLSGTPMENHLGELWSLMHFLQPGLLGEQRQFRRLYRTPIEKQGDQERQASLSRRLAPFLLRRSKAQVASELPPKTEITREIELDGAQRDLYESIRIAMHDKVRETIARRGMARSHIVVLDALLKLRQVCCDPRLVKLARARSVTESAKLRLLMDLLPEMVEEGRRILLFSQFTTMLGFIETELARIGMDYVKLTGRTRDRAGPIERFQAGEVPVFLISLKAGGTGLNLTAADTVIHYDPWWNPAVENQATDRAHRIGQDKPVFVYRLLTAGTVEEKIVALQRHKRNLADALFSGGAEHGALLSGEDLEVLFEPLDPAA